MKKGKGRLTYFAGDRVIIYISTEVHRDSQWPFNRENQDVNVEITEDRKGILITPQLKKEGGET